MSIFNRRNAIVGWLVVKVGKRAAKKKAADAAPSPTTAAAAAGGTAALLGALHLWRKKHAGDDEE